MTNISLPLPEALADTGRALPTTLYHYTDARGLQGIVEKGTLWASSVHHLNDFREYALGLDASEAYLIQRLEADLAPPLRRMAEAFLASVRPETLSSMILR